MAPPDLSPGSFQYARRVQFAETDLAGIVHFSCYFRYMEEAEHALWRAAGLSITGESLGWPRVNASCEYRAPLRFEDEIVVTVRAALGRRRIEYDFVIVRGSTPVATGVMTSVCTRTSATGALETIAIPDEIAGRLRAALQREPGSPDS